MQLPTDVTRHMLAGKSLGFTCTAQGKVIEGFEKGWGNTPYPLPGFIRWNVLEIGNGDVYGYYWPITKEDHPPIVCVTEHDTAALIPESSSLAACLRRQLALGLGDIDEVMEIADDFEIQLHPAQQDSQTDDDDESDIDGLDETDLHNDPQSPFLRVIAAKKAIAAKDPATALMHLNVAVETLPEYAEAWVIMAQAHRQNRDLISSANALMHALTSPKCFGAWDRKNLLGTLQRTQLPPDHSMTDPLWARRNELTYSQGTKENADYKIIEELIEEYHRLGWGERAVSLRIYWGEMLSNETVSFQERLNWDWDKFKNLLRQDCQRAGLDQRMSAIQ